MPPAGTLVNNSFQPNKNKLVQKRLIKLVDFFYMYIKYIIQGGLFEMYRIRAINKDDTILKSEALTLNTCRVSKLNKQRISLKVSTKLYIYKYRIVIGTYLHF